MQIGAYFAKYTEVQRISDLVQPFLAHLFIFIWCAETNGVGKVIINNNWPTSIGVSPTGMKQAPP